MELSKARLLLENLVQKLEVDQATSKWRIVGVITDLERQALNQALIALGGEAMASVADAGQYQEVPAADALPLVLDSLDSNQADKTNLLMCLDFGTAMSKAAVTKSWDGDLIVLSLGEKAGDPDSEFGLRSSLFISRSGRLFFGHEAITKSIAEYDHGRKRLDSLKQVLSQGSIGDLAERLLDPSLNPTQVRFSYSDAILVYLAYFTDIATSALVGEEFKTKYLRRRFARPCWEKRRTDWAEGVLHNMLAKAQILADTLSGKWTNGIPINVVRATIDTVDSLDRFPTHLIGDGVPEPIAAAASRIASDEKDRGLFIVVDIGAGTTDFAAFWMDQDPDNDKYRIWQLPKTIDAIAQAGDRIDGFLLDFVLSKANIHQGHVDFPFASARLGQQIRQYKERLFLDSECEVPLSNGTIVKVGVDEFLKDKAFKDFSKLIEDRFVGVLQRIDKYFTDKVATFEKMGRDQISIVLTGGGSTLPIVRSMVGNFIDLHGHKFKCVEAPRVPDWIESNYPRLALAYPQLAVAIGGAAKKLPDLASFH